MDLAAALAVTPVIAIVRLADSAGVDRALRALIDGGIPALEVTLTTPGALKALAEARAALDGSACLGAGSVRVVAVGTRAGVPVICGGLTPTELAAAHDAGAYAVKVFPAKAFGPGYLRDVLAPMPHLRLVPTGGIDPSNVADYARAGAVAVGAGNALVDPGLVTAGDWAELTRRAGAFAAAWPR